jgi:hypothetical protein
MHLLIYDGYTEAFASKHGEVAESGRLHLTRNQAYLHGYRGFESLPLRQVLIQGSPIATPRESPVKAQTLVQASMLEALCGGTRLMTSGFGNDDILNSCRLEGQCSMRPRLREQKPRGDAYQMTDGRGLFLLVAAAGGKLWRRK